VRTIPYDRPGTSICTLYLKGPSFFCSPKRGQARFPRYPPAPSPRNFPFLIRPPRIQPSRPFFRLSIVCSFFATTLFFFSYSLWDRGRPETLCESRASTDLFPRRPLRRRLTIARGAGDDCWLSWVSYGFSTALYQLAGLFALVILAFFLV